MQIRKTLFPILLSLLAAITIPATTSAQVDWQTRKTIKTESSPIGIHVTADGKRTFILTQGGNLEIYDNNAALIDIIKVDPDMNLISADGTGDRVFLGNQKSGIIHEILVEYIAELTYEGSPYLGKKDAPVVMAVFSDFQ